MRRSDTEMLLGKAHNTFALMRTFHLWQMTMFCAAQHRTLLEAAGETGDMSEVDEQGHNLIHPGCAEGTETDAYAPSPEQAEIAPQDLKQHLFDVSGARHRDPEISLQGCRVQSDLTQSLGPSHGHGHGHRDGGHGRGHGRGHLPKRDRDSLADGARAVEVSNPVPASGNLNFKLRTCEAGPEDDCHASPSGPGGHHDGSSSD